ncbi:hypothetical protein BJV77DRAFT_1068543 [Russula vinacea]|nr:hypothetical protein BJV77DRAFT_1068543 [Russula vinacea]
MFVRRLDLDYVIPFTAILENCREIGGLDDESELAQLIAASPKAGTIILPGRRRYWTHGAGLMDQTIMIAQVLQHVRYFAQVKPAWGDLSSDFGLIANLIRIRVDIPKRLSAISRDNAAELRVINSAEAERVLQTSLSHLRDAIDLGEAVDISGFGKVKVEGHLTLKMALFM